MNAARAGLGPSPGRRPSVPTLPLAAKSLLLLSASQPGSAARGPGMPVSDCEHERSNQKGEVDGFQHPLEAGGRRPPISVVSSPPRNPGGFGAR
jgi:hypothetical protein